MVDRMIKPGSLSDGTPITYASGLHVESRHGATYFEHTGAVAGFLSEILVFPKQHLSVILLANTDNLEPPALAFAIADIYLQNELPTPAPPGTVTTPSKELLNQYAGLYQLVSGTSQTGPGRKIEITQVNGELHLSGEEKPLLATSSSDFFSPISKTRIGFVPAGKSQNSWRVVFRNAVGTEFYGRRIPAESTSQSGSLESMDSDYEVVFFSADLDTAYSVRKNGDKLRLRTSRGEAALRVQSPDHYEVLGDEPRGVISGTLAFTRKDKIVNGFLLSLGPRARDIRFVRMRP